MAGQDIREDKGGCIAKQSAKPGRRPATVSCIVLGRIQESHLWTLMLYRDLVAQVPFVNCGHCPNSEQVAFKAKAFSLTFKINRTSSIEYSILFTRSSPTMSKWLCRCLCSSNFLLFPF